MTETPNGSAAPKAALVLYTPSVADIERLKADSAAIDASTPAGYKLAVANIAVCRGWRGELERDRKKLNEEALAHQRRVNAQAKEIESLILSVEEPLKAKKQAVDDEKERIAREKAEAVERAQREKAAAELAEREAKLRAEREAEEKRLAEERARLDAERAKIAEERRIMEERQRREAERIAAERAKEEAEAAEKRRAEDEQRDKDRRREDAERQAEQARIAEERRKLAEEREAAERVKREAEAAEFRRLERIRLEQEAREAAERDRIAAEEREVAEKERQAELERRRTALMNDQEKLIAWAKALADALGADELESPLVKSKAAKERVAEGIKRLAATVEFIGSELS